MMNGIFNSGFGNLSQLSTHNYNPTGGIEHRFSSLPSYHIQQQRPSFGIQELLGLNSCRHNGPSSDLIDTQQGVYSGSTPLSGTYSNRPGLGHNGPSMGLSHRGLNGHTPNFFLDQYTFGQASSAGQNNGATTFCPWRLEPLTNQPNVHQSLVPGAAPRISGTNSRHEEEYNFGFKHNIVDDGE